MLSGQIALRGAHLRIPVPAVVAGALALVLAVGPVTGRGSAVSAMDRPPAPSTSGASVPSGPQQPQVVIGAIPIHPYKIVTVAARTPAPTQPPAIAPTGVDALGIPILVLEAYHRAADRLAVLQPSCHLPWWLLAGIGHTESGHAESGRLYADGTTRGQILGPILNGGIAGDSVITDTDHGVLDGNKQYDRAVGPMQFIPSTWARWASDGNGDGKSDPNNIFDATLAAGRYLCADGRNLATVAGLKAAVLSYNYSQAYLDTVLAWAFAYRAGAIGVTDSPTPVVRDVTKARPPLSSRPPKTQVVIKAVPPTGKSGSSTPGRSTSPAKTCKPPVSTTSTSTSPTASTTAATPTDTTPSASSATAANATTSSTSSTSSSTSGSPSTSPSVSPTPIASC